MTAVRTNMRRFLPTTLLLFLCLAASCAYFNAYYLASKSFKDAEYERRKNDGLAGPKAKQKYGEAIKWSREVIDLYGDSRYVDDSMYIIALSQYYRNEFVLARSQFDELLKRFPDSEYTLDARFYKAKCYIALGQHESARLILNELLKIGDRAMKGRAGLALAEISYVNEDWENLLSGAQSVIDSEPDKNELMEAMVYKGEALFRLGRYEECIATLERLGDYKMDPELRFKTNILIAQSKAELGRFDEGLQYLSDMENRGEFGPFAPRIRLELGYIHELRGDYELAVETYKNMAGDYPDSLAAKDAWYRVGMILLRDLSNADEARDAFVNVGPPPRNSKAPWFVEAKIRIAQIDSMKARLKRIEELKDDTAARTKTRFALAELYNFSFNRPDSALTQYRLIMEESPGTEYAVMSDYYIRRYELEKKGELTDEKEREIMEKIIAEYPESEFAGKLRGYLGVEDTTPHVVALKRAEKAKFSGKSWEEYIPLYQAVVDSFPETRSAYQARFVLAYSYEHDVGDMEKALELYRELANEDPTYYSEEFVEKAREKLTFYEEEPKLIAEIKKYIADYESHKQSIVTETAPESGKIAVSARSGEELTGLRRIRARNARIRSRYFTD